MKAAEILAKLVVAWKRKSALADPSTTWQTLWSCGKSPSGSSAFKNRWQVNLEALWLISLACATPASHQTGTICSLPNPVQNTRKLYIVWAGLLGRIWQLLGMPFRQPYLNKTKHVWCFVSTKIWHCLACRKEKNHGTCVHSLLLALAYQSFLTPYAGLLAM